MSVCKMNLEVFIEIALKRLVTDVACSVSRAWWVSSAWQLGYEVAFENRFSSVRWLQSFGCAQLREIFAVMGGLQKTSFIYVMTGDFE